MRYPAEVGEGDYVQFSHMKYSARSSGGGGGGGITIYMPNSTPAVGNMNNWSPITFPGPLEAAKRDLALGAVDTVNSMGTGSFNQSKIDNVVDKFTSGLKERGGVGAAAKQGAIGAVARISGAGSASNLLQMQSGEIYNPNAELLYQNPSFRQYTFEFQFIPKNEGDAQAACAIIKEFKTYSAPALKGQKLEIPHVWFIKYSNQYMGKFKPAALTSVTVDYNSGLSQFMTFTSGMPIVTSLQLSFTEVEYVFRKDHQEGLVGY